MTCCASCCLFDTLMDTWNVRNYVCMYVCTHAYTSKFQTQCTAIPYNSVHTQGITWLQKTFLIKMSHENFDNIYEPLPLSLVLVNDALNVRE